MDFLGIESQIFDPKISAIQEFTVIDLNQMHYRVVKQNFQVVRFRDFEHMRARMAKVFCITSRHNIYLLIQSKKLRSEAKTSPES